MKKIKFSCNHCGAKLRVPTHLAGVSAPCPKCGATITAPSDISEADVGEPVKRPAASPRTPTPALRSETAPSAPATSAAATAMLEPPAPVLAAGYAQPEPVSPIPVPAAEALPPMPPANPPQAVPLRPPDHLLPGLTTPPPASAPGNPSAGSPAFFAPPPPEPPSAPFAPDPRADTPTDLPDLPEVVVEEEVLFETPPPPPPSQITEPIRVSRTTVDLPPPRPMFRSGAPAPAFGAAAEEGISPASATPAPPRTRVVLPAPGTASQALSPQDFLAPPTRESSGTAELPPPDLADELPPESAETDSSPHYGDYGDIEPLDGGELVDFAPLDEFAETDDFAPLDEMAETEAFAPLEGLAGTDEFAAPGEVAASEEAVPAFGEEPVSLDELGQPEASDSAGSYGQWELLSEVAAEGFPETAAAEEAYGEEVDWNLDFSIDELPAEPAPEPSHALSAPEPEEAFDPDPPGPDSFGEQERPISSSSLREGSFGKVFAQQAPATAAQLDPASSGAAVEPEDGEIPEAMVGAAWPNALDELFGDGDEAFEGGKRRLSPVMIAMIATLAVVAILAVVGVKVIIDIAGGLEPQEAYREEKSETPPPAADTPVIRPKGSTRPTPPIVEVPAIEDPVAQVRPVQTPGEASDLPALSFDERVQQAVNGGRGASVIGSPGLDHVDERPTDFTAPSQLALNTPPTATEPVPPTLPPSIPPTTPEPTTPEPTTPEPTTPEPTAPEPTAPEPTAPEPTAPEPTAPEPTVAEPSTPEPSTATEPAAAAAAAASNYNPPSSFPVPGKEDDSRLGKTHDLIDAFLRAPDWERRLQYAYQGESLRAAVEDYYRKWPYQPFARYSQRLYQIETDENGSTYWVFLVSTSDNEDGFPLIVRTENSTIKVDWEIFAEFADRHYLRFREGKVAPPATFRLILERFSDYYGSDREAFAELGDYLVFQVNPPYGDFNEFSETVFVKKDSPVAKKIEPILKLGDDPLAVIVTLDRQAFAHGVRHFIITDFVAEGWFR